MKKKKERIFAQKITREAHKTLVDEQYKCFQITGAKPKLETLASMAIQSYYNPEG